MTMILAFLYVLIVITLVLLGFGFLLAGYIAYCYRQHCKQYREPQTFDFSRNHGASR